MTKIWPISYPAYFRDIRPLESSGSPCFAPGSRGIRAAFFVRALCGEVKWEKSGIIQQDPRLWEYQRMTLGQFICKHTFKPCLVTPDSMSSMSKLGSCGPDPRVNVWLLRRALYKNLGKSWTNSQLLRPVGKVVRWFTSRTRGSIWTIIIHN